MIMKYCCLSALLLALLSQAVVGQIDNGELDEIRRVTYRAMDAAKSARNWTEMIRACRYGVDHGLTDEGLLRSLSWAYCRAGQVEDGYEWAILNWRKNPCAWSLVQYAEASYDSGRIAEGKEAARLLEKHRSEWGSAKGAADDVISKLTTFVYEFTWRIRNQSDRQQRRNVPIPQQDPYIQTKVAHRVEGTEEFEEAATADGVRYVKVTVPKNSEVRVIAEVTMSPHSWRQAIKKFDPSAPLPEDAKKLLGKSIDGNFVAVDPTTESARSLVNRLKGKRDLETIENVMRYIEQEIPWADVPGRLNSEECIRLRKGSCTPRSFAAVALLRAAGIPARAIRGHSGVMPEARQPMPHTVPQFYVRGVGWLDSDFGLSPWSPSSHFLRMYYRASNDYGMLGDAVDPTKDCTMRVLKRTL
ncbi:MAG: transglutaminase domain-containing protein [Armatimonadetes bacterium]|nr:MAG: transglutaminase domain-containing protein [Armatimonadota bacterium]